MSALLRLHMGIIPFLFGAAAGGTRAATTAMAAGEAQDEAVHGSSQDEAVRGSGLGRGEEGGQGEALQRLQGRACGGLEVTRPRKDIYIYIYRSLITLARL